jgi:hypothetical protein
MEQHDVGTPGSMPPGSWAWQQQQAVSGPGQGLSAEALQQYLLNPAAIFQRQLEGAHGANILQTMGAQLLLPSLAVAPTNLNSGQQGQAGPAGSGAPDGADSVPSNHDEIPGEDKVRLLCRPVVWHPRLQWPFFFFFFFSARVVYFWLLRIKVIYYEVGTDVMQAARRQRKLQEKNR